MGADRVFQMYREIGLGSSEVCRGCIAAHSRGGKSLYRPLSIWQVGSKFQDDEYKIMFVGKTARGEPGTPTDDGYLDSREDGKDLFLNSSWPYWSYTREIATMIYGTPQEAWEHISFSNIVKCNNSDNQDSATATMKMNCIDDLQVLWKEVEILKPKAIVFYTGWSYDEHINRFRIGDSFQDVSDRTYARPNRAKSIGWWEGDFISKKT